MVALDLVIRTEEVHMAVINGWSQRELGLLHCFKGFLQVLLPLDPAHDAFLSELSVKPSTLQDVHMLQGNPRAALSTPLLGKVPM